MSLTYLPVLYCLDLHSTEEHAGALENGAVGTLLLGGMRRGACDLLQDPNQRTCTVPSAAIPCGMAFERHNSLPNT